jgi:tetratricopeptide (TPR) repeat protein
VNSYELAKDILEAERQKGELSEDVEWTLFDIYDGIAHAYRDLATSERDEYDRKRRDRTGVGEQSNLKTVLPTEVKEGLQKAELYFNHALTTQEKLLKGSDQGRLAGDYEELAQAYLDNGKLEFAEAKFKHAVELRHLNKETSELESNERAALIFAQKKLAEVYQLEGRRDEALRILNEMVILQEDITVDQLAQEGQEIANSYSDLGQLYSAMGETNKTKADNAYRTANLLQRTGMKLGRAEKYQGARTGAEWLSLVKDLTADLDELGDAYAQMGKRPDAGVLYLRSLEYRQGTPDLPKSYVKLRSFYLEQNDYATAEEYNKLLIEAYKVNPKSDQYVDTLVLLARVYAADSTEVFRG